MANLFAIHSVGDSLITYLRNSYPAELQGAISCDFRVFSSGELADDKNISNTISLYLYRVTMNEHLRNVRQGHNPLREDIPLSLDLHFLLTVWADGALAEQVILAWAMRQIYLNPTLNASSLSPEAGWDEQDVIQLIPAELSNEDMMRIWDALEPSYRLSFSYIARVVRIEADTTPDSLPVVARRLTLREPEVVR
jgi:hypothetical protein